MEILQICVGQPKEVPFNGERVTTSIFKSPVEGEIFASLENLDGDRQSDLTVHGGRDKAIYVYSYDYYPIWAKALGAEKLQCSQFGENLTVKGGLDTDILIGDRYRVGDAEVIVTQPRIPCFKLGVRFGVKQMPKTFWEKGMLGFYLRVEKQGVLKRGDVMKNLERPKHGITVRGLWTILNKNDKDGAARAMAELHYLDSGWKKRLSRLL